ncbi:hypothetical protein GNY06_08965 [Elizabethkingia argentiflava]|uniref:Uncharacterized protein n=1 Tax=Elizabethkingia argenteiflava TaxID=2681556 RepID=A0A845PTE1_9FLAO|nr:hypothetical protein [Elizabethkingia argenteiflava]NAW51502.1 hypothetical protein [Elizabethkingia argenteiflava]
MVQWKFAIALHENEEYKIKGLNIWNFSWNCVDKKVEVQDPYEGNVYYFKEYEIENENEKVNFVAGEFSNLMVGIYLKDDLSEGLE